MSELDDRESDQGRAGGAWSAMRRPRAASTCRWSWTWTSASPGCRICIDSCPVDCLAVNPETGKAHMAFDECWYCLACEIDCPKDAITVKIPFLLR